MSVIPLSAERADVGAPFRLRVRWIEDYTLLRSSVSPSS